MIATTLGEILESFPTPAKTWPGSANMRGSWPLNWPASRPTKGSSLASQHDPSSGTGTALGRGVASQRTTDTPLAGGPPNQGCFGCCFGKYDPGDRTPTGRLMGTPIYDREKDGSDREIRRRCCGLPLFVILLIALVVAAIIVAAILTPILVIRQKNAANAVSLADCQARLPCLNNGASIVVAGTSQCACLCAGGFSGMQCQTQDSSCTRIPSIQGVSGTTSIGSAIPDLIETADTNFSSQFNLSPERIVERFAAANLSCTAQNALINLNGSTAGTLSSFGPLAVVDANASTSIPVPTNFQKAVDAISVWSTTTITTTLTQTFSTTVPFVSTSSTTFSMQTQVTTLTSTDR